MNAEGWISVHCFDCQRNDELRAVLVVPHLQNRSNQRTPSAAQTAMPGASLVRRAQRTNNDPASIWQAATRIPTNPDHPAAIDLAAAWCPELHPPSLLR